MLDSVSFKYFLGALISLVVITNPLSKIPLFMSLAAGMTHEQRKQQANLAAIYSFAVMFVSLIGGNLILSFFGISFGAMRIAGGHHRHANAFRRSRSEQRPCRPTR